MAKKTERNLIVGLDIGTSKVAAIVGELSSDGTLEVIGIGSTVSRGLKKAWWSTWNRRCNPSNEPSRKPN